MAASEAVKKVVWLRKFLMELEVIPLIERPLALYYDNMAATAQMKEPCYHTEGKHIEHKFYLICEIVQWKEVEMLKIASLDNLVDPSTKILIGNVFTRHVKGIGAKLW